jgi:molybdenum cofactor biosynthesis enzyme MoaA
MCNVWINPSLPEEEICLDTLAKIPTHVGTINLTGGEPILRRNLGEIVGLRYPQAQKLEISSNGDEKRKY